MGENDGGSENLSRGRSIEMVKGTPKTRKKQRENKVWICTLVYKEQGKEILSVY